MKRGQSANPFWLVLKHHTPLGLLHFKLIKVLEMAIGAAFIG